MRVLLVAMPWLSSTRPSLALGTLTAYLRQERPAHQVEQLYATLDWIEFLHARTGGRIGIAECEEVALAFTTGVGDWVFTSALYRDQDWPVDRFLAFSEKEQVEGDYLWEMRRLAPAFIDDLVAKIERARPDVIGLTSTFSQNIASLALIDRLKEAMPSVRTVLGGANCDGEMGETLHREFDRIDFVVRGEGEVALAGLLDHLSGDGHRSDGGDGDGDLSDVPGLCWRAPDGIPRSNPIATGTVDMDSVPAPAFDEFFERIERVPRGEEIHTTLVMETSRGCWWGERRHCTFCGLNGSAMAFRSKSPQQAVDEIGELVARHGVLDIVMADNIISTQYFTTMLPALAEQDWDLRMYYEVKANLRDRDLDVLKAAGVVVIQPGIESLSTDALRLMRKGVDAAQNVRVLRAAEERAISVTWNFLYGFPGEEPSWYSDVIPQLPNLHHLQPPDSVDRIVLERFSPYFDDPSLGFAVRSPAATYRFQYDLSRRAMNGLAYFFSSPHLGIDGEIVERLKGAVASWQESYTGSSFTVRPVPGGGLELTDTRGGRDEVTCVDVPWQVEALLALRQGMGVPALLPRLEGLDDRPDERGLSRWLDELTGRGWLFRDGRTGAVKERYVLVAVEGQDT
jgi:ribosomal peptide maturation radical SAM protein 1